MALVCRAFPTCLAGARRTSKYLARHFEAIQLLASSSDVISRKDAFVAIGGLLEKVADVKLKGLATAALSVLCEAVGPQFVCVQVHKKAAAHKNPKVDHQLFCSQKYSQICYTLLQRSCTKDACWIAVRTCSRQVASCKLDDTDGQALQAHVCMPFKLLRIPRCRSCCQTSL